MITEIRLPRKPPNVADINPRGVDVESDEWRAARACAEDLKELMTAGPVWIGTVKNGGATTGASETFTLKQLCCGCAAAVSAL
jgi:hypothetical protein